jgi:hypothetical protein
MTQFGMSGLVVPVHFRVRIVAMADGLTSVNCVICSKPVPVEECLFNEVGDPLHDACLARWMQAKEERKKPAKQQTESVK